MATCVLVIGGTGLIGPWVLAALRREGAATWVLNRRGTAPYGTPVQGDRREGLRAALAEARPDVLIDMIAFTVAEAEQAAAELAAAGVPRAVVISSADVYEAFSRLNGLVGEPPEAGPITEGSPLRVGEGAQGAAYDKLGVERAYAARLPDVASLRLPAVYGWPDRSRIAGYAGPMLDGAEEIALHPSLARWRFARVLNSNAGEAVALAALRAPAGHQAWNVAEPVTCTEAEWAARIGRALGWRGRIVESEAEAAPGFDAAQDIDLSDALIRADLGYREVHDTGEGLADAMRRFAEAR